MFGFSKDEAIKLGSHGRFYKRIEKFRNKGKSVYKHHFWWLVHNCIAHFLLGIAPIKWSFQFHDWTSKKLNGE